MPRPSKPYLRKQTKSWYCSIDGRQVALGKDRETAFAKFHEQMADRSQVSGQATTLYELSQAYLDWCKANRKTATYERHRHFLKRFIDSVGKRMRPAQLRVHHVVKWHEGLGVAPTTQNDAVGIVQRMLNWAAEQEYLPKNPILGMKKPRRSRRDIFYTPEQWQLIREHSSEPLTSLLDFLYLTGC
ncbi:MAG: integrase, partial [Planctomycetota bacterium]